jgi:hypothetical protein
MVSRIEYEEILQIRREFEALRLDWRRAVREYYARKYRPDQPRVPAGSREGGQWANDSSVISDATPDNEWKPGARYASGPRVPKDRLLPLHVPVPNSGDGARSTYRAGQVTITNNAQTGISTIDETTEKLVKVLENVVNSQPEGSGPRYGTKIHTDFGDAVRAENLRGIGSKGVERTYGPDPDSPYGSKDSIRTDVVLRNDIGDPIAIYDVKTGNARLGAGRVQELREKTGATLSVPVIEMHVQRGLSLKAYTKRHWQISLRLWNPWVRR